MSVWTEELIRKHLDGTFTQVDHDGKVRVGSVEDDFMPKYPSNGPIKIISALGEKKYTPWGPTEDDLLLALRRKNYPLHEIAAHMERSEEAVRKRLAVLRLHRGPEAAAVQQ